MIGFNFIGLMQCECGGTNFSLLRCDIGNGQLVSFICIHCGQVDAKLLSESHSLN